MLHLVVAGLLAALSAAPALPDYLQPLASVWTDESALTEALRTFDKEKMRYIDAQLDLLRGGPGKPPEEGGKPFSKAEMEQLLAQVREGYESALRQYPRNPRLLTYYGELLYDRYGDHVGALRQWHLALTMDSKHAAAYNNLALHHFHVGEYDTGLRHMDAALKYDKKNPDYLYNMGNFYLAHFPQVADLRGWKKDRVYKEAMKLSERAIQQAPEDYDLLQDYAVNFYAAENFGLSSDWDKAAKAWQAARAQARSEDERFYCWLNEGRVWLRAETPEKAIPCLEEALRLRPDSVPARQLLDAIREAPESGDEAAPQTEAPNAP